MQSGSFVHRQMIGLLALDQVLGLVDRGPHSVALEPDLRRDLLPNDTGHATGLRIPMHSISNFERPHRSPSAASRVPCLSAWTERYVHPVGAW